ncbi:MAG TPA: hypothetical protein VN903_36820, partial [Polyangia bacterium]|nr:hypothetical protein [Polyangia bacterium]
DVPNTFASTVGPVDWDGDGATDATNISADLNSGFDHACGAQLQRLPGASDWVGPFSYKFQCTAYGGPNSGGAPSGTGLTHELTTSEAIAAHVLYPPRSVRAILGAGSALARDRRGSVRLIVHGAPGFSVADVDATSLFFHGARPAGVVVRDLNGDGRLDLVATFKRARATLHPKATRARLRGWLIDGQLFTAEIALP